MFQVGSKSLKKIKVDSCFGGNKFQSDFIIMTLTEYNNLAWVFNIMHIVEIIASRNLNIKL